MSISINKILPYFIAIPIFYLATFSIFYPELLDNRELRQTDIVQFAGMKQKSIEYYETHQQTALWNVGMFSGFPEYLIAGFSAGGFDWIERITAGFLNSETSAHVFFRCLFCAWVMLLCFRLNPYIAIVGAIAFGFNTYGIVTLEAGHFTKMWAIAYACIVLGGMSLMFNKKYLLGLAVFMLGLIMELRANHIQITYYLAIVCVIYGISELVYAAKEKQLPAFGKMAALLIFGAAISVVTQTGRLWTTLEYTEYSTRGPKELKPLEEGAKQEAGLDKDYAFNWSQGKIETLTLLVPYLYGGGSGEKAVKDGAFLEAMERLSGPGQARKMLKESGFLPLYHGDQPFTSGPVYAGAILVFLFVLAMLILPNQQRWWMLIAAAIAMFIAWGGNFEAFNYFLFDYVPGFNKFRSPSMALSMTIMVMTLGGMLALQKAVSSYWDKEMMRHWMIAFGATAGLSLLLALGAGMMDVSNPKDATSVERIFGTNSGQVINTITNAFEEERVSRARMDGFRSFAFIALAALVLFLYQREKLSMNTSIALVGALLFIDVWFVDSRYIYDTKFSRKNRQGTFQKSASDEAILKDKDPHYRVLDFNSTWNQASSSYYHKTIGGYFAAKLGRYQDLIDRVLLPEQQAFITSISGGRPEFKGLTGMNMLNAKYFKFGDGPTDVIRNTEALGNAWFVSEVKTVQSPDEEIALLPNIDPAQTAVIDQSNFELSQKQFEVDSAATIQLTYFDNRKVHYESNNSQKGLAVFSEVYYPKGWEITIDGQPAEMVRVNYVLRALEVPAGKHDIKFEFKPESYLVGNAIGQYSSYASLVFILIVLGFAGYREAKP